VHKFGDDKGTRSKIVSNEDMSKPGPGHYEQHSNIGKGTQSFTIGGKGREDQRNDSPGPGHYDLTETQNKDRVVAYKIGSSQR
jgi:hypothetical protein